MLDHDLKGLIDLYYSMGLTEYDSETTADEVRERFSKLSAPTLVFEEKKCEIKEHKVPTKSGEVTLRGYYPEDKLERAPILFFRGSGFVVDNFKDSDAFCMKLAESAKTFVLSVDYPLAPENPFPSSIDACYEVYLWTIEHISFSGMDSSKLILMGESSGGCFVASLAEMIRDLNAPTFGMQILLYPVLDHDIERPSYQNSGEGYILTKSKMQWYLNQYISEEDKAKPYAFPLNAKDYSRLPKTLILAAGLDPLCDEASQYAKKLKEADVPCEILTYPGLIHGFMKFRNIKKVDEAHQLLLNRIETFYKSS